MATLALFVALGGTSYAALKITSRDIVNRTIKGGDIAKDSLGGTEIRESRLKQVPSAARADSATAADVSKNADHATQATTANSATTAITADSATAAASAANAQQLAGQAASAYERSTRTQFGRASNVPAAVANETTVLSWPELGVAVTSASNQGSCGGDEKIGVKNTKAPGGSLIQIFERGQGFKDTVAAGATKYRCSGSGADNVALELTDDSGRTMFVDCIVDVQGTQLRCLGTRSEP